jgi:CHASE2 domain-containing sensor protein
MGGGAEPEPDDAVLFVGVSLVLGIASRHLLRGTRVPYTVALLVLGVALGSLGKLPLAFRSIPPSFACLIHLFDYSMIEWDFQN